MPFARAARNAGGSNNLIQKPALSTAGFCISDMEHSELVVCFVAGFYAICLLTNTFPYQSNLDGYIVSPKIGECSEYDIRAGAAVVLGLFNGTYT